MSVLDDQRADLARTPQAIVTLGVRYCQNHYAQIYKQNVAFTDDPTSLVGFAKTAGTTVTLGTYQSPDGTMNAATIAFAAAADEIHSFLNTESLVAASHAFTGTWWVRTLTGAGAGTISLRIRDASNTEATELQLAISETWTRLHIHRLFTGGAGGGPQIMLVRRAGDVASVAAWRPNLTENPGNVDADYLFPTVYRASNFAGIPAEEASRCTAPDAGDGARCFYSFPTCQDKANFSAGNSYEATAALRGIREFRFCMKTAALPLAGEEIRPYITSVDYAAQKIDPEKSITTPDRVSLNMDDDNGPGLWDPQKATDGAKVNTALEQGTFFRRFLAIFKNYANPACYAAVKRGFVAAGMTEALYDVRGTYLIQNIVLNAAGTVTFNLAGRLKLLRTKIPSKISTTNLLDGAINNSQTTLRLDDASEVTPVPTDGAFQVVLLIDTEKMNVVSYDPVADLFTVQRGRWGTAAASHLNNAKVTEIAEFGTERTTPNLTPLGINYIEAAIQLLRRGGIPAANVNTTRLFELRDNFLATSVDPATGVVSGPLARRTVTDQIEVEKLLGQIRDDILLDVFTDEDDLVSGRLFAPALPTETLATLTDDANFLADSQSVDDNDESRVTRVVVASDLATGAKGDSIGDYNDGIVAVEPELESDAGYGEQRAKIVLSQWIGINDTPTATRAATLRLARYRNGVRKLMASIELKDDTVKCGDFVLVTSKYLQRADGSQDANRQMLVASKQPKDNGQIYLLLVDAILPGRPGFIAPAGYPDYDSASPDQRRYCYIGSAGANKVGATHDDGYTIW